MTLTFRSIRHSSFPFLYVFSDYKRGGDHFVASVTMTLTFRSIRHHHFLSCMSFLTTKDGPKCRCIRPMTWTFRSIRAPSFPFLYVFSDYKRGGGISLHPVTMTLTVRSASAKKILFSDYKEGMSFRCIRH